LSSGVIKFKNKAAKDNIIDPNIPDRQISRVLKSLFFLKNKPAEIM
jgi:hypothetical protein